MNTAPTRCNGVDIELHHITVRVQFREQVVRFGVGGFIPKLRSNDCAVDNEVVDVTGRKIRVVLAEAVAARIQWR
ncbi:hypothetical protein D3C77_661120 [compost metagenome]